MPNELLGWDADFYNSLSTDTRNVSLSEREIYVLGNLLPMVSWRNRWSGDTSALDLDAIRGEMEFTLLDEIIGGEMACEDIADCIETDEEVQTALVQNLTKQAMINQITEVVNNSGFGNPNHINVYSTTAEDRNIVGALQEDIKPLENCNLDKLWAGIRYGIVTRLNDTTKDLLEDLVPISDVGERAQVFIDTVPIFGDLAEALMFQISAIVPDMLNLYESYESEAALDEIACEIFEIVCSQCRYPTFEEVINLYAAKGLPALPPLSDATLNSVAEYLLDLVFSPDDIAYFTLNFVTLLVLNMQAVFNGVTGTRGIVDWATLGEDSADNNWLQLCDGCGSTYRKWTWDFKTQGQGEFYADTAQTTSKAQFVPGVGWRAVNHNTGRRMDIAIPHDPNWKIRAVGINITGATSSEQWFRRPTWGSTTGQSASSAGSSPCNADYSRGWDGYAGVSGYNELVFFCQGAAGVTITLDKITIIYEAEFSPETAQPTEDVTLCS